MELVDVAVNPVSKAVTLSALVRDPNVSGELGLFYEHRTYYMFDDPYSEEELVNDFTDHLTEVGYVLEED